ncbi:BP74-related protein [Nostoc sp.]|uniref:BP74-related protein n=1 Tax=Nostoc sp. TaxID=1180 RepID=UPI003FA5E25A
MAIDDFLKDLLTYPSTISFFPMAIEVCDATTNYVNDHLDEVGGAFLPGLFWCPWSSQLVKEIS